jgi:hypothetical protein
MWAVQFFRFPDYLLTPWSRVRLENLIGSQLVKKFPACSGTGRIITAFTRVHHLTLSWVTPIQSMLSHPTSWRSILILSFHLDLGLPSGSVPQVSPPKPCIELYASAQYIIIIRINEKLMMIIWRRVTNKFYSLNSRHSAVVYKKLCFNWWFSVPFP